MMGYRKPSTPKSSKGSLVKHKKHEKTIPDHYLCKVY